jgi:hypothetical protein
MTHFIKYYILTALIFGIAYVPIFFIETKATFHIFKATNNIISFIFPLMTFYFMIRHYKGRILGYAQKVGHITIFLTYLCLLSILVKLINPANLHPTEEEEKAGLITIIVYYGIFEFLIGLIMIIFTKQKSPEVTFNRVGIHE